MMRKNIKDSTGKTTLDHVTLGMPKEMSIVDICRGMHTGWPQLIEAMKKLMEDPQFCNSFRNSYGSGGGLMMGGPKQLVANLMINPALIAKSVPPSDVYAWSVWLTARVYEAALTIASTLEQIPEVFSNSKSSGSTDVGMIIREVFNNQAQTAGNIVKLANDFADHLEKINGDLDAAQTAYQAIGNVIETQQVTSKSKNMMTIISTHTNAVTASHRMDNKLEDLKSAAAKVTAFAVITNMIHAIQSLAVAWQATLKQFEEVAHFELEKLGDITFLEDSLQVKSAGTEWKAFAEVIRNFMKRALVH